MSAARRPGVDVQRQHVLDATRRLLRVDGVEALTAARIAQEAGISRATFYRCFASVEAVVDALYAQHAAYVTGRLTGFLEGGGAGTDWLPAIIRQVIDDAVREQNVLVAMFREELRPGATALEVRKRRVDDQVEMIKGWWTQSTGLPPDAGLIRVFVLLLQVVGLEVALRPEMTKDKRDELQQACEDILAASIAAYVSKLQSD